ncbi:ATP-NAD kinase [Gonapodya prolifera JEL478]|uniref:ATP-NAD kinase n=1 Tax=Gonapodya prolifera (strain JEL478) TaxID=1344416 RepID=A0A139AYR3_GONPJ|nr:ATP-NAD kinase [Gonapodya prolifera JEL478]|eukprot:KXS21844.1 ATP-NAD kinase [Gonapodya prolifera JEL478]
MIVTKAWDNTLIYLTKHLAFWLITSPRLGVKCTDVYLDSKLQDHPHIKSLADELSQQPGLSGSEAPVRDNLKFWDPEFCAVNADQIDFIITLGGDGTVLYTSWLFQRSQVPPIIPFHLGSLGFLTVFNFKDIRRVLRKIVGSPDVASGDLSSSGLRVNLRMRVTCTVWRSQSSRTGRTNDPRLARPQSNPSSGSTATAVLPHNVSSTRVNPSIPGAAPASGAMRRPVPTESFQVLNDLVVDRGPSPYMSQLELYGDDRLLTVVQADGLVISTPTGSTAYSLSAGGSVVHPEVPALLVTPICPHTLSFRPMMLPDSMELKILLPKDARTTAFCSFDGRHRIELRQGDYVTVTAGRYPCPTICATDQSQDWFEGLSRTLHWNERARQKPIDGENEEGEQIVREFLSETEDGSPSGFHPHQAQAARVTKSLSEASDEGLEMHDILGDFRK